GRSNHNNACRAFETIHFNKQLVERLLALVVTAAQTGSTLAAHRINFINEDNARGVLLCLVEQVSDAGSADTDEHFHEIRSGDAEEGHAGFTRYGLGQ